MITKLQGTVKLLQIMLPCSLSGHWSLYAWDLDTKRINVLDPVMCQQTRESQGAVHSGIIATLHDKLFDSIFELFSGVVDDRCTYKITFYNLAHPAPLG